MQIKHLFAAIILGPLGLAAQEPAMADAYDGSEMPKYTVTRTDGPIELRDYAPRIMAEVTVTSDRSGAGSQGFRILAGYIFGSNEGGAKVAMTTPVSQAPGETIAMTTPVTQSGQESTWSVQFMMPSSYTLQTLPKPKDDRIRFVTLPAQKQVVLTFSGTARDRALTTQEAALRDWAKAQGLRLTAGPFFYFYDPPWTMPWNRRNEVAFDVQ